MHQLKLPALICFLFSALFFTACKKENNDNEIIENATMPLTRAQVVVPGAIVIPPSSATGNINGSYSRERKLFSYTVTWTGLTANPTAIHIHGIADAGFIALPAPLGPFTNGILQSFTSGFQVATTGSYSGSLYVDGIVVKEE
ncbi:MAG: CHRD domain-containing protein, partial [Flavisolibacter sp.]|nr:CHRD domain-containing protein [Flavisolibacter sp.]